jgi:hypothetical protein
MDDRNGASSEPGKSGGATNEERGSATQGASPAEQRLLLARGRLAEKKAIVKKVRAYMETNVAPVINNYWCDDAFPFELFPTAARRSWLSALRLHRRKPQAVRLHRD